VPLAWPLLVAGAGIGAGTGAALAAYALHPLVVPLLLVAVLFVLAALHRPAWGLAGAFLAMPLELVQLDLPSGALSPAEAAFAIVAVCWVLRAIIAPDTVVLPSLRDAAILVLLGVMLVGVAVAVEPSTALRVAIMWAIFYIAYLTARSLTVREVRLVTIAFVVATGVLGLIGTADFLQSNSIQLGGGGYVTGDRAEGTFVDPNYYASLLLLGVLPAVALLLGDPRQRIWLAVPVVATLAGITFSLSRGAIVGVAFGTLVILLAAGRGRGLALGVGLVLAATTMLNVNPLLGSDELSSVNERLSTLNKSLVAVDQRPRIWEAAIDVAGDNPLVGVGTKQFETEALRRGITERGAPVENVHNIPLGVLAEQGVIGLAAFLVFLGQLFARGLRALRLQNGLGRALALGLLAGLSAFLIQGLTQSQLRVNVVAGAFFVVAGMLTALADLAGADQRATGASPSRSRSLRPLSRRRLSSPDRSPSV
jgi:O-antigen ligase